MGRRMENKHTPSRRIIDGYGGWQRILRNLTVGEGLTAELAEAILNSIMAGEVSDARIAGFVVAMRMKNESATELTGMVRAMLNAATPLDLPDETIDIVGTGGAPSRMAHALNVSTMSCFVAAAAGAVVCKHGNVKASSTSGSFDFLEALGVQIETDPVKLSSEVRNRRLGFAYARAFHPAMRHVAAVRGELGIPTLFNILGPLSHPGRVKHQVVGVSDPKLVDKVAEVLLARGAERAMVVHGEERLDELTTTGLSQVREIRNGTIGSFIFDPADLGLKVVGSEDIRGGSPADNAKIFTSIIAGEPSPQRDIVALNAAAGLVVAGLADELQDGLEIAAQAIDNGRVAKLLNSMR